MLNKLLFSVLLGFFTSTLLHAQQASEPLTNASDENSADKQPPGFTSDSTAAAKFPDAANFLINDIRLEGLQRIPAGSVFASLPFNIGDSVNPAMVREAIAVLFRSGNFNDVTLGREENVLVIALQERPSIASIEIEGNKAIKSEDLLDGLSRSGLSEGQVFKRATLEGIRLELQRQYVSQGRYDAQIVAEIESLPRNRVAVHIDVDEGTVAKIKHINIVGNQHFPSALLTKLFEMQETSTFSWLKGDDKYAKERLRGDLERLESFYKDQGYMKFSIDSTQVALSPERDAVFITVNISEGDVYTVSEVKLSGEIILPEPVLRSLILLKPKNVYSQSRVTRTEELISKILGNDGYTFAKVRNYPKIDDENKTVELTFFVDPGKRTYVNRIEFRGNTGTMDEVLRREMRQMESAPASGHKIEQSRVRLERLGFFKSVQSDIVELPGEDDLVDIVFDIEEQHSGSIGASVGYADGSGLVLSANLQQNNFLGTGKRVGFSVTKNDYQLRYSINYTNPYYTIDGVSRGFSLFYKETDFDQLGVAEYSTNSWGGAVNYGYPISEISRLGFGFGIANIEITTGLYAPQEIIGSPLAFDDIEYFLDDISGPNELVDIRCIEGVSELCDGFEPNPLVNDPYLQTEEGFIDRHGNEFLNLTVNASWRQSKLNRGMLPDKGYSQSLSFEAGLPSTDLEYYKFIYEGQYFLSLTQEVSLRFHTKLGIGEGYGDTEEVPFFEHFYAGGFGSVRGYERASIGPKGTPAEAYLIDKSRDASGEPTSDEQGYYYDPVTGKFIAQQRASNSDSFGGNILSEGGVELIFPLWFIEDRRSLRTVLFVDAGNVFDSSCGDLQLDCYPLRFDQLRASYGFGLTWISALGPLSFSLSEPINATQRDDTKFFQFTIGTGF